MNKKFGALLFSILFIFVSLFGTANSDWLFSDYLENNSAIATNDESAPYVCYNKQTGVQYRTIEMAIKRASANQSIYTIVDKSYTLNKTITLSNGISLYLAIDDSGTVDSPTESSKIKELPTALSDRSSSTISQYRKFCLNLRNGADIIVEQGSSLYVGGEFFTAGCTRNYTEINLGLGSSITVNGLFQCYGFVKEYKDDAVNPKINNGSIIDNADDANRYISITSTGQLKTYMGITKVLAGAQLASAIQQKKLCPFWTFDFAGLQTYVTCHTGGKLIADAVLNVGTLYGRGSATIIGAQNDSAMFRLSSGQINLNYVPNNLVNTDNNNSITYVFIDGNVSFSNVVIPVDIDGMKQQIDTKDFATPISYKLKVILCENATLNVNYKVKFLNESYLEIRKNASFIINSEVIFYSMNAVTISKTTSIYDHNKSDSTLINNGKIIVNSNGKLGAFIQHNSSESTGQIDFSSIGSNNLTVSVIEDPNDNSVEVSCTGLYANESNEINTGAFISGQTYSAGYNSSFGTPYYWNGSFNASAVISVNIEKTSYKYSYGNYSIYTNSSQSTEGQETLAEGLAVSQTYSVPLGNYIRISAPGVQSVSINIGGIEYTYDANAWIKVNSGGTINITPSEGTKVYLTSTGAPNTYYNVNGSAVSDSNVDVSNNNTDSNPDAGRGDTELQLLACDTASGTFSEVDKALTQVKAIVKKGSYLRTHITKWGTGRNGTAKSTKFYCIVRDGEISTGKNFDPSSSSYASSEFTFETSGIDEIAFTFGFQASLCINKGTPILLSDGTYKNIEDISYNDKIMTWNFFAGKFEPQKVSFIIDHGEKEYEVLDLSFSDGSELSIIGEHGVFDYDENEFVYLSPENYKEYIGHSFVKYNNNDFKLVKLVSGKIYREVTNAYSITSYYNSNAIAGNLLTAPPPGDFYNWIAMSDKLRYDVDAFKNDVETYGLYDYSIFEPYGMSYEIFEAFNIAYFKIPVSKGIFTFEYVISLFDAYKEWANY